MKFLFNLLELETNLCHQSVNPKSCPYQLDVGLQNHSIYSMENGQKGGAQLERLT
jgi:hypothetical protein